MSSSLGATAATVALGSAISGGRAITLVCAAATSVITSSCCDNELVELVELPLPLLLSSLLLLLLLLLQSDELLCASVTISGGDCGEAVLPMSSMTML